MLLIIAIIVGASPPARSLGFAFAAVAFAVVCAGPSLSCRVHHPSRTCARPLNP
jgi:hypothetical protein